MFAILTEHCNGVWPLWLSPKQVMVIPVQAGGENGSALYEYATQVCNTFCQSNLVADVDLSGRPLKKCVREATLAGYSYIAVVGTAEMKNVTVTLRQGTGAGKKNVRTLNLPVQDCVERLTIEVKNRSNQNSVCDHG